VQSVEAQAPRQVSDFFLLCSVGFFGRLSYEMLRSPITSLYAKHIGAPTAVIGLLVAAVTITGIFVKFPSGALSDIFGFRRLMLSGLLVKASAPFLYLLVQSWTWLLAVRFYHGLSTALYAPAASASVAKLYPEQRGRRLGIYGAFENAGVVFGPVLGAAVLGWSTFNIAFLVSGVIGIVALLAILPFSGDGSATKEHETPAQILHDLNMGLRQIIGNRDIRLVSLMEGTLYSGVGTLQAYLPLYALTIHVSIARIGLLFGVQGVASILWRPFAGAAADRFGRRPFIIGGVLLSATVLAIIPYQTTFFHLLILTGIFGLGTGTVTPSTTAAIGDLVKQGEFGAAMGVFGSLWDIGHASGPLIAGILIASLGYRIAFLIMALIILTALAVYLLGTKSTHTPQIAVAS
jgi:DHA1 family multidrug resistance protein-like MFS transporter